MSTIGHPLMFSPYIEVYVHRIALHFLICQKCFKSQYPLIAELQAPGSGDMAISPQFRLSIIPTVLVAVRIIYAAITI